MELSPEALELKRKYIREYMKEWRKRNPEKNKEYVAARWERLAEEARKK